MILDAEALVNGTLIVMIIMMSHDLLTREYWDADDADLMDLRGFLKADSESFRNWLEMGR